VKVGNLERLSEIKANNSVIHALNDNQRVQNHALPMPSQRSENIPALPNAVSHAAYETIAVNGAITPKGQQLRPSIIMKPYHNQNNKELVFYRPQLNLIHSNFRSHTQPLYSVPSRTHHLTLFPYHPTRQSLHPHPMSTSQELMAINYLAKKVK
jgi:hypothetical protein